MTKRGWSSEEPEKEIKWTGAPKFEPLFPGGPAQKAAIEAVIAAGRHQGESLEDFMARAAEAGKSPYRQPGRQPGEDDE